MLPVIGRSLTRGAGAFGKAFSSGAGAAGRFAGRSVNTGRNFLASAGSRAGQWASPLRRAAPTRPPTAGPPPLPLSWLQRRQADFRAQFRPQNILRNAMTAYGTNKILAEDIPAAQENQRNFANGSAETVAWLRNNPLQAMALPFVKEEEIAQMLAKQRGLSGADQAFLEASNRYTANGGRQPVGAQSADYLHRWVAPFVQGTRVQ